MTDNTEALRMVMTAVVNSNPVPEEEKQWTTSELTEEFEVLAFIAPFVVVKRKSDGVKGSLMFKDMPRVYFSWQEAYSYENIHR